MDIFFFLFRAPNDDYSTSNLQTVNDNIYLNLFDEVVVDIQQVTFVEYYLCLNSWNHYTK